MTQLPVTIRQATVTDAQALAELHIRAWQWAYRGLIPDDYLDSLSSTRERRIEQRIEQLKDLPLETRWWVVEKDGALAGFAMTGLCRDSDVFEGTAEVYAIYLAQEIAGKGIGRALFTHAVEDLRQRDFKGAILWVLESNQRAHRFYEAAGWKPDGTSKTEERPAALLKEMRYHLALQE